MNGLPVTGTFHFQPLGEVMCTPQIWLLTGCRYSTVSLTRGLFKEPRWGWARARLGRGEGLLGPAVPGPQVELGRGRQDDRRPGDGQDGGDQEDRHAGDPMISGQLAHDHHPTTLF